MPNKLNNIIKEEKGEYINFNDLIGRPKLSFKKIYSIVSKKFYRKYNKYYTETKIINNDWGKIRPNIYGLYQINNLLDNKKSKIKVYYDEFHFYYNNKENLVELINKRQSMNLLKFIVTFLQGNNKYNTDNIIKEKYKYKSIYFRNFIKIIISKLNEKESFKNSILSDIIDKVQQINKEQIKIENEIINNESFIKAYEFIKNNNIFEFNDINDLSDKLEDYLKYLPILINIPLIYYKCILPNYFLFGYKINNIIKNFITKTLNINTQEKMNILEIIETKRDKVDLKINLRKNKMNTYSKFINESSLKSKGISFKNKNNKEENIDNKPVWNFFKTKKKIQNRRNKLCNEISDIEKYLAKMNLSRNKSTSFLVGKNEQGKARDPFLNKIMHNKNKNNTINIKASKSLNSNIDIIKNKIIEFLNQKSINDKNKSRKRNKSFSIKNYNKRIREELKEIKNKINKKNVKNFYNTSRTSKIITEYKTKYDINSQKYITQSMSDTKNSSSGLYNSNSSYFNNEKNINTINNLFYSRAILSTVDLGTNNKINFLQNNSSRDINKNNNNFKNSVEFIWQSLKNSEKSKLNRIELKNIKITSLNQKLKNYLDLYQNYFNFPDIKKENKEKNEWEKGIYKEQKIMLDYNYKKLMKKIDEKNNQDKKRCVYRNLLDKKYNMMQISKMDNIYGCFL